MANFYTSGILFIPMSSIHAVKLLEKEIILLKIEQNKFSSANSYDSVDSYDYDMFYLSDFENFI